MFLVRNVEMITFFKPINSLFKRGCNQYQYPSLFEMNALIVIILCAVLIVSSGLNIPSFKKDPGENHCSTCESLFGNSKDVLREIYHIPGAVYGFLKVGI